MKPESKLKIEAGLWGAASGAVVAIVIGFAWGGWTTAGGTQEKTDEALLASRAAICVAQFLNAPNHQENLDELTKLRSWDRRGFIEKGGWDKMPGQKEANYQVSRACVDGLELVMKK